MEGLIFRARAMTLDMRECYRVSPRHTHTHIYAHTHTHTGDRQSTRTHISHTSTEKDTLRHHHICLESTPPTEIYILTLHAHIPIYRHTHRVSPRHTHTHTHTYAHTHT